jgi:agmatine deiminase
MKAPHAATWMAFGASAAIWEPHLLPVVRKNLALVAKTIAAFEPVNMLVREEDHALAANYVGRQLVHPIDDLWIRDTGPVFVKSPGGARRCWI